MDLIKRQEVLQIIDKLIAAEAKNKPCVFKILLQLYTAIDNLEAQETGDKL